MSLYQILVGEQNQYRPEPRYALFPYPEHATGGRLCTKIMGMSRADYMRLFVRKNLLGPGKWNAKEAKRSASLILLGLGVEEYGAARIVLLGAKVCAAFDLGHVKDFEIWDRSLPRGPAILRLPHPSGRCRVWNEPGAYDRARAALRAFLPAEAASRIGSLPVD